MATLLSGTRNERRLAQLVLAGLLEYFDLQLAGTVVVFNLDAELLRKVDEIVRVPDFRHVEVGIELRDDLLDRHAREWLAEVVSLTLVRHRRVTRTDCDMPLQQRLDHHDQIFVVGVGTIQLEHREFRVVLRDTPSFLKLRLIS